MIFDMIAFKYPNLITAIVIGTFGILSTRVTKAFIDICNDDVIKNAESYIHIMTTYLCTAELDFLGIPEDTRTCTRPRR